MSKSRMQTCKTISHESNFFTVKTNFENLWEKSCCLLVAVIFDQSPGCYHTRPPNFLQKDQKDHDQWYLQKDHDQWYLPLTRLRWRPPQRQCTVTDSGLAHDPSRMTQMLGSSKQWHWDGHRLVTWTMEMPVSNNLTDSHITGKARGKPEII